MATSVTPLGSVQVSLHHLMRLEQRDKTLLTLNDLIVSTRQRARACISVRPSGRTDKHDEINMDTDI